MTMTDTVIKLYIRNGELKKIEIGIPTATCANIWYILQLQTILSQFGYNVKNTLI